MALHSMILTDEEGREHQVHIDDETGDIIYLHNDELIDLIEEGTFQCERASNVEFFSTPDGQRMGWVILTPGGDPWSCSLCFGKGKKQYDPCGCCFGPDYCNECDGSGFEVFNTRGAALKHEAITLNSNIATAANSCEFDPFNMDRSIIN